MPASYGQARTQSDVFTVSQLNQRARQLLEISFSSVKVEGEISNLSRPSSGHWYFTLKDSGGQIRCAMFKSRAAGLRFQPKEGDKIIVRGKVSLYENRGDYQLIVDAMKPVGEGQLQQAFLELKQRLLEQGIFASELKKPLPEQIQRIAIITSATGAAIHDTLSVLKRRSANIAVDIYPTQVQGQDAAVKIRQAIQLADNAGLQDPALQPDVILLTRGGGSLEDLWCFNDEQLAYDIFNCRTPIVSAVGHEVDFTIADFAADLRAPTPSAAAELLSPDQQHQNVKLQDLLRRLNQIIKGQLSDYRWQVKNLQSQLLDPRHELQQQSQFLDNLNMRLVSAQKEKLHDSKILLAEMQESLQYLNPRAQLAEKSQQQQQLWIRLQQAMKQSLHNKKQQLASNAHLLNTVSPLSTLGRGYSILQNDQQKVIDDAAQVSEGESVTARLAQGQLHCIVSKVITDKN